MPMSRKHYVAVAEKMASRMEEVHGSAETFLLLSVVRDLAGIFQADNPNFDRNRFLAACGVSVLGGVQLAP